MNTLIKQLQKSLQTPAKPDKALQALKNRYAHYEALVGSRCAALPTPTPCRRVSHPDRLRAAGL